MNIRTVFRLLGIVAALIGCSMIFSLPWAGALLGGRWEHERDGVFGLLGAIFVSFAVALGLRFLARGASQPLFRKEAMAVVALSWILATFLGGLPFYLSGTQRAEGVPMSVCDALFESQSGFSTTGATVLGELQREDMVPRCILFWRCMTHFLGGLGIMVLFVAILGQGSVGKAMMKVERATDPHFQHTHVRQTAWILFVVYLSLNAVLTVLLCFMGLTFYDAMCHAFSAVATGGFSTYNASVGHFAAETDLPAGGIEWTLIVFMFLGGTNFMLLYVLFAKGQGKIFRNVEWRTYVGIAVLATVLIFSVGMIHGDFTLYGTSDEPIRFSGPDAPAESSPAPWWLSLRFSAFHVVSTMTTTGFCTDEYEKWSGFARGMTLALMLAGGCVGSTAGGIKILRLVIAWKVGRYAVEQSFRPSVVRSLRIGDEPLEKEDVAHVPIYVMMIGLLIVAGTLLILLVEPTQKWYDHDDRTEHKLVDVGGCVISTLGNVGPSLGIVGAKGNYGDFTEFSKLLFVGFMMLGRLELYVVLALFYPAFWKSHA